MVVLVMAVATAAPVDRDLDAVVLVRQGSATCAGVHLGGGRIATAYHCVAPGGRPGVVARTGEHTVARVVGVDRGSDLAVLEAPGSAGWPALSVAPVVPHIGAPVRALGHPYGEQVPGGILAGTLRWSSADGEVAAVGDRALQITAPLNPGNSGGPVVDAEGRVAGIVSRRLTGENLGFAGRADRLAALLDAQDRALSPVGGTVAVHGLLTSQSGADTGPAVGVRAEIAARDRVVLDAAGFVPLSARWNAARYGASASVVAEGRLGLRQRFGRGPWAVRTDVLLGGAAVRRLVASDENALLSSSTTQAALTATGALQVRTAGFEVGWIPELGITRATLVLRWPGVLAVY